MSPSFILVGLYTGTRSSAICGAAFMPTIGRGHVDLEQGVFYRRAIGRRQTKKRQPPVKLPPRLLAHMRRWQRLGLARHAVVEWNGKPVESVRKGFAAAVARQASSTEVTPHILRHTCATWLMQKGVNLWDAAGFLGMTVRAARATSTDTIIPTFRSEPSAGARGPARDTKHREQNSDKRRRTSRKSPMFQRASSDSTTFGTWGSQVQILPLRPILSQFSNPLRHRLCHSLGGRMRNIATRDKIT